MNNDTPSLATAIAGVITFLVLGFIAVSVVPWIGAYSFVGAGHVGVVTRLGAVNRVANPGMVFKIPLIESVKTMETRTQLEQVEASSASKDVQTVYAVVALNFHLQGDRAVDVYQNIGEDYKERVIAPAIQESFKASTAKFSAFDLIQKREEVKQVAFEDIKVRLEKYNIIVDDLNIVDFDFNEDFNTAIEDRQVAEQNKERAKTEAETALIQAQGQADAQAKLRESGSLTSEYLQFLAVQKWNGIMPNAVGAVPFVQIPNGQ